ncbi:carboxymuconolactone decarboxylase family protein [Magnetospirillum sulfuroxidans]|uniref:Carboxymuconolactone decarboxylase family protein n=1 Tax=Magnetospirillum sulfuroxidans TaxID=611300 RepID=A0ABS5IBS1_9PROT|nr:carboxymuconolactone decarboxylase family protein [Magnetospirillum sulfuroxidans]MBR9971198.1 carboxymuconolactone decarboxylase family protein [Magnetospirillum sulfuroxidans]
MANIPLIDPAQANASAKPLLDGVKRSFGAVPNIFKAMANSPATLDGYLAFAGALGKGGLDRKLREHIALAVAGINACTYCASAHAAVGKSLGIGEAEARDNLLGKSAEPKVAAALTLARALVTKRGRLSEADFQAVRNAGYGDDAIVEIIGHVALNIFTNYFNLAAGTEVDFPRFELT